MLKGLKNIFKDHSQFLFLLFVAIALRAYRIDELTTFGGDQGQDFLVVKDMVLNHKWTLIGIKTSIAPFFQGPLYLYILYPFFVIFNFQPIAGPIAALFVSVLTMVFLYLTSIKYFSKQIALLSVAFFAVSPQFIIYGNTPLYQHFLPLFIIMSLYLFLSPRKNMGTYLLLGLTVGLGMELHFLNIVFALALVIYFLFIKKGKLKTYFGYFTGLLIGLSPTIVFELRHNFLNLNLFLNYQQAPQENIRLVDIFIRWIDGAASFLGGNFFIAGLILLLALLGFLIKNETNHPAVLKIRKLTLIIMVIVFLSSLRFSTFAPHYFLPVWVFSLIVIPQFIVRAFPNRFGIGIMGLILTVNLAGFILQSQNNHGYFMPAGWTMRKIDLAGKIISRDALIHPNFNVASLLDSGTRAYPLRYATEIYGGKPDRVENYPNNNYLYVVTDYSPEKLFQVTTWEITSLSPFRIGEKWDLSDNIGLYRLERIISPAL